MNSINSLYVKTVEVNKNLPTIISFSSVDAEPGKFKPYRFILETKLNVIFVNDIGNSWYQYGINGINSNPKKAAKKLVEFARSIGNGKVVCFGTSMGAFGAVMYGYLGGADACLGFGPKLKIDMPGSKNPLKNPYSDTCYHSLSNFTSKENYDICLLYTEDDAIDYYGANKLQDLGVDVLTITGCEHPGVQIIIDSEYGASNYLRDFALTGKRPSHPMVSKKYMSKELAAELYHIEVLARSNKLDRILFLRKAENLYLDYPESHKVVQLYAESCYINKKIKKSEALFSESLNLTPYQPHTLSRLGDINCVLGKYDDALGFYKKSLSIEPRRAFTLMGQSIAFRKLGQLSEAEKSIRAAMNLKPKSKKIRLVLIELLNKRLRVDRAELKILSKLLLD